jgi:hypothetical protein
MKLFDPLFDPFNTVYYPLRPVCTPTHPLYNPNDPYCDIGSPFYDPPNPDYDPSLDPNNPIFAHGKNVFLNLILNLVSTELSNGTFTIDQMTMTVNNVYDYYLEISVNCLIANMNLYIDFEGWDYELDNLLTHFYNFYTLLTPQDRVIKCLITETREQLASITKNELECYNTGNIVYYYQKNILYNLIPITSQEVLDKDYTYPVPMFLTNIIASKLNLEKNDVINTLKVEIVDCQTLIKERESRNPIKKIELLFNEKVRVSLRETDYWNFVQPYQCFEHTPKMGLNIYSFALFPLISQLSGSANLGKLDTVRVVLYLDPIINEDNLITITNMVMNYNVYRVLGGQSGLAFELDHRQAKQV